MIAKKSNGSKKTLVRMIANYDRYIIELARQRREENAMYREDHKEHAWVLHRSRGGIIMPAVAEEHAAVAEDD